MGKTYKERLTLSQKNADDKAWYKEKIKHYSSINKSRKLSNGVSVKDNLSVNYDLYNNILNIADLDYVCNPFGEMDVELPAKMANRDIVSGKIKVMLGMEQKAPFAWNALATNSEATTRKEQEEFGRLKDYVISQVTTPIRQEIELRKAQENASRDLTPEEVERIQQEIEEELAAQTPEEVRKYMQRDHQDPAEAMTSQLLNYLMQKCEIRKKFNTAFKHSLLSAVGCVYLGAFNGEPHVWNVNSKRLDYDRSPDLQNIEDGEYASCTYPMTPSQIVNFFRGELTDSQIDSIYESWTGTAYADEDDLFTELYSDEDYSSSHFTNVTHTVWRSLRRIGFLSYYDEAGNVQEMLVDETYKINKDFGDIKIEWEWIPEVYEGWEIAANEPIYVNCRPIPGQFKDIDNLGYSKLPYYGVIVDNMNSTPTSLMDRLKMYQYFFNIIYYRIELLMASDKGKKLLMNIGAIPSSQNINIKTWQYYMEATPTVYFDTSEEGNSYQDANTVAKVLDLSLASDIDKYINIAENIRLQAGASVGITDPVEGQIGSNDAVSNTRQTLVQSSHILSPYFDLHSEFKRNVLQGLIELAKVTYSDKPTKLSYFLDDMSVEMFTLDIGLIDNSSIGIFISNSAKAEEIKETIRQLSHAAMQNQTVEFSDVLAVIRQDDILAAEEIIKTAQEKRIEREQANQEALLASQAEENERERMFEREKHEMEKEIVILKEEQRRETVIAQAAITGMSFNPDVDVDGDGVNDFLEIAKHGLNADIQKGKLELDKSKFKHQEKMDKEKLKVDKAKVANKNKVI